jgi:hypothetical protein
MLNHGIQLLTVSTSWALTTFNHTEMYGHQFSAMELQAPVWWMTSLINLNRKLNPVHCLLSFSQCRILKNDFQILRRVERNAKSFARFLHVFLPKYSDRTA